MKQWLIRLFLWLACISMIGNAHAEPSLNLKLPTGWKAREGYKGDCSYIADSDDHFKKFFVRWVDPALLDKLTEEDMKEDFSNSFKGASGFTRKQELTIDGKLFFSISATVRTIDDIFFVHNLYSRKAIQNKICNIWLVSWYDGNINDVDFTSILKSIKLREYS